MDTIRPDNTGDQGARQPGQGASTTD
jgi:hypothetical protein